LKKRAVDREIAREVARFNAQLQAAGRRYVLIGVGRWGSSDPFLGIPVAWNQIANCVAIVEAGFRDFKVTPSQGSHFFQNITSSHVGYFTVNPEVGDGFVDWDWLIAQPAVAERDNVRLLRFDEPIVVRMNGPVRYTGSWTTLASVRTLPCRVQCSTSVARSLRGTPFRRT
jgi:hypothetical protein